MLFNLVFFGKDETTKEDKIIFSLDSLELNLEIFCEKKKYFFVIKKKEEKIKEFSISDKKIGNNKPGIEIASLIYSEINKNRLHRKCKRRRIKCMTMMKVLGSSTHLFLSPGYCW